MAENNEADWMLINLKFRGKCIVCGKEITSGRAFWSKTTKSIKHLDCSLSNSGQTSKSEGDVSHEQKATSQKRYKKTVVPTCFICGNAQPEEDEYDIDEYPYLKEIKSPSYICKSCLQGENTFEAYREAFLQKIKRYMK